MEEVIKKEIDINEINIRYLFSMFYGFGAGQV